MMANIELNSKRVLDNLVCIRDFHISGYCKLIYELLQSTEFFYTNSTFGNIQPRRSTSNFTIGDYTNYSYLENVYFDRESLPALFPD